MRLMILLSRVPYPLDKGDKIRAYHQIKWLAKSHEIYLCCLNDRGKIDQQSLEKIADFCKAITIIDIPKWRIGKNLMMGMFSNKPFQVKYFYHRFAQKRINQIIEDFCPDHIYCQLIRTAEYVRGVNYIPKTIDFMDALSKGVERRIKRSGFILRSLLKVEARRLLRFENLVFEYFDQHTIISAQDQKLIYHQGKNKMYVIPNGVNCDFFSPINAPKKEHDLVFIGNMSYPPNIDAVEFLVTKIIPEVHKAIPNVNLLISGTTPHKRVEALKGKYVTVSGWVDDIRMSYSSAKVFVAPMQIGTGLQNKLLEAMSMGLPCVTSQLVNNALRAEPNKELLIGNTAKQYADHIVKLLNDDVYNEKISQKGHQFVKENYNWKQFVDQL